MVKGKNGRAYTDLEKGKPERMSAETRCSRGGLNSMCDITLTLAGTGRKRRHRENTRQERGVRFTCGVDSVGGGCERCPRQQPCGVAHAFSPDYLIRRPSLLSLFHYPPMLDSQEKVLPRPYKCPYALCGRAFSRLEHQVSSPLHSPVHFFQRCSD